VLCGLGRQVGSTGHLGEDSVKQALEALSRFKAIARILGSRTCGRSPRRACRDASDGPEFIARGERALGTRIRSSSATREAELAANGIMMGFRSPDGVAGDLGGGSLELIEVEGAALRRSATLPARRACGLLDASGDKIDAPPRHRRRRDRPRALDRRGAQPHLLRGRRHLAGDRQAAHGEIGLPAARHARLHHADRGGDRVLRGDPQGQEALRPAGRRRALQAAARGAALRRAGPRAVARALAPSAVDFSVFGIREGLVYSLLSETERRKDPLISFCREYARLRPVPPSTPSSCAAGPTPCSSPRPQGAEEERRLRHAACLLSDISWRAHRTYRGEQSLNLIAHAALGGIDHPAAYSWR
jgi:exopolyphosphatase/guanosine-5'-triphosphate,3'-diphosphate pyrophosphatase